MSTITRSASASPMALNGVIDASLFPLKSTADVINLFRRALTSGIEPDLTLLSIVVGYIELSLTTGEAAAQAAQAAAAAVAAGDISQATTGVYCTPFITPFYLLPLAFTVNQLAKGDQLKRKRLHTNWKSFCLLFAGLLQN